MEQIYYKTCNNLQMFKEWYVTAHYEYEKKENKFKLWKTPIYYRHKTLLLHSHEWKRDGTPWAKVHHSSVPSWKHKARHTSPPLTLPFTGQPSLVLCTSVTCLPFQEALPFPFSCEITQQRFSQRRKLTCRGRLLWGGAIFFLSWPSARLNLVWKARSKWAT